MDRSAGTLLLVLGIVLVVGGVLTVPIALWVWLWGGFRDDAASAIGFGVLIVVLWGLGTTAIALGARARSRPPQV
jgi:hypothetical protein